MKMLCHLFPMVLSTSVMLLLPQQAYSASCLWNCENYDEDFTFTEPYYGTDTTCKEVVEYMKSDLEDGTAECTASIGLLESNCVCYSNPTNSPTDPPTNPPTDSPMGPTTSPPTNPSTSASCLWNCENYDEDFTFTEPYYGADTTCKEVVEYMKSDLEDGTAECTASIGLLESNCVCYSNPTDSPTDPPTNPPIDSPMGPTNSPTNSPPSNPPTDAPTDAPTDPVEMCSLCDNYDKTAMTFGDESGTKLITCEEMNLLLSNLEKSSNYCSQSLAALEPACGCVEKCSLCDNYNKTGMTFGLESMTSQMSCEEMNFQIAHIAKSSSECTELLPLVEATCGCVDKNVEKCSLCDNYNKTATTYMDEAMNSPMTCEAAMSIVGELPKDSETCSELLPIHEAMCGCKPKCVFCSGKNMSNPNATIGPFPYSGIPEKLTCLDLEYLTEFYPKDHEMCEISQLVGKTCGCPFDSDPTSSASFFPHLRIIFTFVGFFALL